LGNDALFEQDKKQFMLITITQTMPQRFVHTILKDKESDTSGISELTYKLSRMEKIA